MSSVDANGPIASCTLPTSLTGQAVNLADDVEAGRFTKREATALIKLFFPKG